MVAVEERKRELVEAVLRVFRYSPAFDKVTERSVKRVLMKLNVEDLTLLANVADDLLLALREALESRGVTSSQGGA